MSQYGRSVAATITAPDFQDTAALSFVNLYMYGGGFDMAAALIAKIIAARAVRNPPPARRRRRPDRSDRGVAAWPPGRRPARRIGRRCPAGRAAPIFYGHMFINPKDAPFAVAMVILLLGLVRAGRGISAARRRAPSLIFGLGAGLSLGSRIMGGMAAIYAVVGFAPLLIEEFQRLTACVESVRRLAHVVYCAAARPGARLSRHGG